MQFDYSILWQSPGSLLTYLLLACSIISLWIKRRFTIWGSLLMLAIISAMMSDRLTWPGVIFIAVFSSVCYLFFHVKQPTLKVLLGVLIFIMSVLLGKHQVPGFYNWLIAKNLLVSENAMPFNLYLNFDTPLVGLLIVGLGALPLLKTKREFYKILICTLPFALIGIGSLAGVAYLFGYVHFEPKWNSFIILFFFNNLIFSVFSQEVLFRGFVQQYLSIAFKKMRFCKAWGSQVLAILIASILFALIHTGGMTYIVLAFFAGLLYGAVYAKTKCIEASMLTHIILNMTHILLFTYPGLG